jgi:hypothetical protein
MTRDDPDRRLTELHEPRRNRFFDGKFLSAADFEREQDYGRGAGMQHDRLVLGAGVVCGLEVTVAQDGRGVHVAPGLALDGWGRRIVVPSACELPAPGASAAALLVRLSYEVRAADPVPALGGSEGAGGDDDGEAMATWAEGHRLELVEGSAPAVAAADVGAAVELIRAGRLDEALALLARAACADPPSDPGVTLAALTVGVDGALAVDEGAARAVVPTNLVLLELVAALAARVEELSARG